MAFGDIRVARNAERLIDRVVSTGSLVLRDLGETRAGELAVARFLSSPYVSVAAIVAIAAERTALACAGRRVLAVQDTSEINFSGRDKRRRGFGPGGDGKTPGYFIHPVIAVDVESEAVLGLVDASIWTRREGPKSGRRSRLLEDKESKRWLDGCRVASEVLHEARSVTMVADRESDIFALFAHKPERLDVIVRAAQDRCLAGGGRLFQALDDVAALGRQAVRVAARGLGEKERIATVELRAKRVTIARPRNGLVEGMPKSIELTLVEAREIDAPIGAIPLLWRLLTTHTVTTLEAADEVVNLYRLRWRIEQTFRTLKSDGLALEDSQVIDARRMFHLAALGLVGAVRTMQLVDARNGSIRPATDVIDDACIPALERLSAKLEGKTEKQKNPHPKGSLAFVAWVAARLGGWNCYYKPPGPKTMRNGWNKLTAMIEGYLLATQEQNLRIP